MSGEQAQMVPAFTRGMLADVLKNYQQQEVQLAQQFEQAREALAMVRGCRVAVEAQIAHLDQQSDEGVGTDIDVLSSDEVKEPVSMNGRPK